jgi:hypothetical protein
MSRFHSKILALLFVFLLLLIVSACSRAESDENIASKSSSEISFDEKIKGKFKLKEWYLDETIAGNSINYKYTVINIPTGGQNYLWQEFNKISEDSYTRVVSGNARMELSGRPTIEYVCDNSTKEYQRIGETLQKTRWISNYCQTTNMSLPNTTVSEDNFTLISEDIQKQTAIHSNGTIFREYTIIWSRFE